MGSVIDEDICLETKSVKGATIQLQDTHSLEVSVDHSPIVHIIQPPCDISQLREPRNRQRSITTATPRAENLRAQTDSHLGVLTRTG